jgi:hypothetical protein
MDAGRAGWGAARPWELASRVMVVPIALNCERRPNLMSGCKAVAVRLAVVVFYAAVLCSVSTDSASAGWFIEGTALTGTAALSTTAAVDENALIKAAGVTITCKGTTLNSTAPQLEASGGMLSVSSLTFNECSANANCTVASSVGSVPILADLAEEAGFADKIVFLPKTKTVLATIKFEGGTCALLGVQPITGKATAKMPTGQIESASQQVEANVTEASAELKVGSSAAEFKDKPLFKLATDKVFALFARSKLFEWQASQNKKVITFTVKKIAGTAPAKVEEIEPKEDPEDEWNLKGNDYKGCEGAYPEKGSCSFEVEFTNGNMAKAAVITFALRDEDNGVVSTLFTCTPATCK